MRQRRPERSVSSLLPLQTWHYLESFVYPRAETSLDSGQAVGLQEGIEHAFAVSVTGDGVVQRAANLLRCVIELGKRSELLLAAIHDQLFPGKRRTA